MLIRGEHSLDDLLSDPIARLLMAGDGLVEADVKAALRAIGRARAASAPVPPAPVGHVLAGSRNAPRGRRRP